VVSSTRVKGKKEGRKKGRKDKEREEERKKERERKVTTCKGKSKVIPLQARCGPEGGYRYSSTLP